MTSRPFAAAFPPDYDPAPVRRAASELAAAVRREDAEAVEQIIWGVAGNGVPGYVLFDLILASSELAAASLA
jgi:hypothetical protein